jgi:hypothetical protein
MSKIVVYLFVLINIVFLTAITYQPYIDGDLLSYQAQYEDMYVNKYELKNYNEDPFYYILIYIFGRYINFSDYLFIHKIIFYSSFAFALLSFCRLRIFYLAIIPSALYFFDIFLNGYSEYVLRQGSGLIVLFIFGFYSLKINNGYMSSVLASFFHISFAIIPFVLLFSSKIKSVYSIIIIMVSSIIIYMSTIPMSLALLFVNYDLRALSHVHSDYVVGFKYSYFFVSYSICVILFSNQYRQKINSNEGLKRFWSFYSIGILISVLGSGLPYIDRIFSIFWICQYFIAYDLLVKTRFKKFI